MQQDKLYLFESSKLEILKKHGNLVLSLKTFKKSLRYMGEEILQIKTKKILRGTPDKMGEDQKKQYDELVNLVLVELEAVTGFKKLVCRFLPVEEDASMNDQPCVIIEQA